MPIPEAFLPQQLGPKEWGVELLVAHTPFYTGKILTMRAGAKGPLQYHREKDETFHLVSGLAYVRYRDETNALMTVSMQPGESYHIPPGTVHQVEALEPCVFFEASTPHFDDRVPA